MKYPALIVSGTVILTAAVSSTVAAVTYLKSQQPLTDPPTAEVVQPSKTGDSISTTKNNPPSIAQATPTPDTDFSHWRIQLVDESTQSPEFAKFFDRFKQAVRSRDAQYIRSLVTPSTKFSFGQHRSIDYLNPDDPKSPFWSQLEKAIQLGCSRDGALFSCPTTFRQFDAALKDAPADQKDTAYSSSIIVVGQNVNVRSQPSTDAPTIAALTNEIVRYDAETFQNAPEATRSQFNINNPDGWTPIILPNSKRGYVSNQYAYSPIGYRAIFGQENGHWVLQAFVTGD